MSERTHLTDQSMVTQIEIRPLNRPVNAEIQVPGSKSITNRALLLAALSDGTSTLENALFSEDSHWGSDCLRLLGIAIEAHEPNTHFPVNELARKFPAHLAASL